jgi:hypothetical protein
MPERRRAWIWGAGIVGVAVMATAGFFLSRPGPLGFRGNIRGSSLVIDESSPLPVLHQALRESDPRALAVFQHRLATAQEEAKAALSDADAEQWIETLGCLRTGYLKFSPPARATAAVVACRILERFTPEPAPANWLAALGPVHDILSASMADGDSNVRFIALGELARFWVWMPGRSLTPVEEDALGRWKESLHRPVIRCLASSDVRTRIGAIACLGSLPIDSACVAALPYLDDPQSVDVRRQTLVSFAQRPSLMTEEMLLKRLHDVDPSIRDTAAAVLKARGLTQEQISLGGLLVSPNPAQRASVIALIKDRTDIDPIVWLLQLSHDPDETVRLEAVEALAHKTSSVSIRRRLAELATSDRSAAVRQAAGRFIPSAEETTASLPPLPGSSILNPKAN